MALSDLLDALRQEAARREADELARADAEAERIRAESRAARERHRGEYLERVRRAEEEAAGRALSRARGEAVRSVLAARGRLLGRVASALTERIRGAVSDPSYLAALGREVQEGLGRLPPGDVVVRAHPALVDPIRRAVGGRHGVAVEAATETGTGFTAVSSDARVEVDATLEARMTGDWPELAVSVLRDID